MPSLHPAELGLVTLAARVDGLLRAWQRRGGALPADDVVDSGSGQTEWVGSAGDTNEPSIS